MQMADSLSTMPIQTSLTSSLFACMPSKQLVVLYEQTQ